MNALEIKNLTKSYRDFTLDNLNLTLPTDVSWDSSGRMGPARVRRSN